MESIQSYTFDSHTQQQQQQIINVCLHPIFGGFTVFTFEKCTKENTFRHDRLQRKKKAKSNKTVDTHHFIITSRMNGKNVNKIVDNSFIPISLSSFRNKVEQPKLTCVLAKAKNICIIKCRRENSRHATDALYEEGENKS